MEPKTEEKVEDMEGKRVDQCKGGGERRGEERRKGVEGEVEERRKGVEGERSRVRNGALGLLGFQETSDELPPGARSPGGPLWWE